MVRCVVMRCGETCGEVCGGEVMRCVVMTCGGVW